ncbi:hypothetical protein [Salmonella phage SSBI34]|nr:hypothetical protein [Salmonella phage SSBI34]
MYNGPTFKEEENQVTQEYSFIESFAKKEKRDILKSAFSRVREFNLTARKGHDYSEEMIDRQKSFCVEELNELKDALLNKDRKETIDALADLFVVVSYWDFLKKLKVEAELLDNIEDAIDAAVDYSEIALDPGTWAHDSLVDLVRILSSSINSFGESHFAFRAICTILHNVDLDIEEVLEEVLSSNESKIPTIEQFKEGFISSRYGVVKGGLSVDDMISIEAEALNKHHAGRYKGIRGEVFGNRVVFKDDKGKIMKPCTFFEPNLEKY